GNFITIFITTFRTDEFFNSIHVKDGEIYITDSDFLITIVSPDTILGLGNPKLLPTFESPPFTSLMVKDHKIYIVDKMGNVKSLDRKTNAVGKTNIKISDFCTFMYFLTKKDKIYMVYENHVDILLKDIYPE